VSLREGWDERYGAAIRELALKVGISLVGPPLDAPFQEAEYRRVFTAMARDGVNALMLGDQPEPEHLRHIPLIVELAEKGRLPAMYPFGAYAAGGGLMAYSIDLQEMQRHAADQIDQILKGTKPGDIPYYQLAKFALIINLKTAKALGLARPPHCSPRPTR
jgi:ABC-type uncharacterized transport system substrate-binding protein